MKKYLRLSNEDILMIVLACVCFSLGIWINYKQLWLESVGFDVTQISRILSVALICSAVITFIISLLSTKVKVKNVIMFSILFRAVSMSVLLFTSNPFIIKTCMLLSIMCETIFALAIYPLIATVNKSDEAYRKHILISYIAKDAAIVFCGLALGIVVGKFVFDLNSCLFLAIMFSLVGAIILLLFEKESVKKKEKDDSLIKQIKKIFSNRINNDYLLVQFVSNIPYGIIFGLIMLILTKYISLDVSYASIFIIGCNIAGSFLATFVATKSKKMSIKTAVIIKYGIRTITYALAFLSNNLILILISIIYAYIPARSFDDVINGRFINKIDTNGLFLFGNVRYFIINLGEGVGIFLAGILLNISFRYLFLGATIFTLLQALMYLGLAKMVETKKKK